MGVTHNCRQATSDLYQFVETKLKEGNSYTPLFN
jgi:hypothetical protein